MNELLMTLMSSGFRPWNEYREETGYVPLDLSGADLLDLGGDDEWDFTLRGYDFSGCDLSTARLPGGLVTDCNFRGAVFSRAVIEHTVFRRCDLSEARFLHTHMAFCKIAHCSVGMTTFGGCVITSTRFEELSGCSTVVVPYKSSVDIATLAESRGCGDLLEVLSREAASS